MNLKILLLFLSQSSLVFAAISHHVNMQESTGRIVGGQEAKPHSHPYIVSLQIRFLWVRMHICGGSLLNDNWVLTAAHCITESWVTEWLPLDAVAGIHDVDNFGSKAQIRTIDGKYKHPLYDGGVGPNDIALMKTDTPFNLNREVQPIYLPTGNKANYEDFTLPGWGALRTTYFIPDLPSNLQEVKVTYVPYKDCFKAVEELKDDDETNTLDENANICTGPLTGGIAACNGDSGGPLVEYINSEAVEISNDPVYEYETSETSSNDTNNDAGDSDNDLDNEIVDNKDYEYEIRYVKTKQSGDEDIVPVIVGIVSWGMSPCGDKGAPTVYTRVSNYIDFINEYIHS